MINRKFSHHGLTLSKVMVAGLVLTLTVLGATAALNSSVLLGQDNSETMIAMKAAIQQLSVIEQYNAEFGLDATYTAFQQSTFSVYSVGNIQIQVPFLAPNNKAVGSFEFPEKKNNSGNFLDETVVVPAWEMPRDLNGDADNVDNNVASSDLELLPVRIVIKWKGHNGPGMYKISTVLHK